MKRLYDDRVASKRPGGEQPAVRLGTVNLRLPAVSAAWVKSIKKGVRIRHRVGGSARNDTWVFPGYRHNHHMLPSSLATKLRAVAVSPARPTKPHRGHCQPGRYGTPHGRAMRRTLLAKSAGERRL